VKHNLGMLLCSAIVSVAVTSASAADKTPARLHELPPLLRSVSDEPGALSLAEGQALSRRVAEIAQSIRAEIIVVILTTTRPESIDAYAQRLINHWRRASQRLKHGRFVFVTVAKGERELRIVPSEKLAWVLTPLAQSEVAVQAPALLKQDKYYEALTAIAEGLFQFLTDDVRVLQQIETQRRVDETLWAWKSVGTCDRRT